MAFGFVGRRSMKVSVRSAIRTSRRSTVRRRLLDDAAGHRLELSAQMTIDNQVLENRDHLLAAVRPNVGGVDIASRDGLVEDVLPLDGVGGLHVAMGAVETRNRVCRRFIGHSVLGKGSTPKRDEMNL